MAKIERLTDRLKEEKIDDLMSNSKWEVGTEEWEKWNLGWPLDQGKKEW